MCTPGVGESLGIVAKPIGQLVGSLVSGPAASVVQPAAAATAPAAAQTQASKTPDTPAMMAAKRKAAGGMGGGTLLTGNTGAMPGVDQLGKATLLGQ